MKLPEELRHGRAKGAGLPAPLLERTAPDQDRAQPVYIGMEIPLGRGNRPVPEEKLNLADVDPFLEQMRREAVPKHMR